MNVSTLRTHDIPHALLAVLFIIGLIAGFLWVLPPFIPVVKCAITIAVASWPILAGPVSTMMTWEPDTSNDQSGAWRNGTSFGLNDLEALIAVAEEAKQWIEEGKIGLAEESAIRKQKPV